MYCHIAISNGKPRTLTLPKIAPCMVHYKIAGGGILVDKTAPKSLFRLTPKISGSQPEIWSYNPDEHRDGRNPCNMRKLGHADDFATTYIKSVRRRPCKSSRYMKMLSIQQALKRAKNLRREIHTQSIKQCPARVKEGTSMLLKG